MIAYIKGRFLLIWTMHAVYRNFMKTVSPQSLNIIGCLLNSITVNIH
jgi:hypothetical protein